MKNSEFRIMLAIKLYGKDLVCCDEETIAKLKAFQSFSAIKTL